MKYADNQIQLIIDLLFEFQFFVNFKSFRIDNENDEKMRFFQSTHDNHDVIIQILHKPFIIDKNSEKNNLTILFNGIYIIIRKCVRQIVVYIHTKIFLIVVNPIQSDFFCASLHIYN